MPHPIVALRDDLPFLRKLVVRQAKENALLLRALANERLLALREADRVRRTTYMRSEN